MASFSFEEVETLLHIARDATLADTFGDRLTAVTEYLSTLVPNTSLTVMVVGPDGPGHMICRNRERADLERYATEYMRHDPMVLRGPFGSNSVVTLSDFVGPSEFGQDPFTGEFLPRQGLRHVLGVSPSMPDRALLSIALHREAALGDFTPRERQLIRLAYPDLARAAFAALLQEKIARLAQTAAPGAAEGGIVFDERGDVLEADDGALGICVLLGGGQGRVPTDLFVAEVRQLAAAGVGASSERTIPLAGGGRAHLRLDVVTHPSGLRVVGALRVDRGVSPERVAAFAERHRLSPRERDVAALAAEGLGNRHIGYKLGISEVTVGVYLGKVYRKTGTTNRTELARALLETV
ncbi:MAG: helix-turn-helix transcriptional regulator [Planctomycetes bacterium]|nr:helix-turn-helix transcriptional regulator [Planctomycetota bacterium]